MRWRNCGEVIVGSGPGAAADGLAAGHYSDAVDDGCLDAASDGDLDAASQCGSIMMGSAGQWRLICRNWQWSGC